MWIFKLDSPYQFRCAPRPYNGGVLTMTMRNELKGTVYNISITDFGYYNGILTINFATPQLREGDSFEIELKENDNLIYRGKGYATAQTDLENYKLWH